MEINAPCLQKGQRWLCDSRREERSSLFSLQSLWNLLVSSFGKDGWCQSFYIAEGRIKFWADAKLRGAGNLHHVLISSLIHHRLWVVSLWMRSETLLVKLSYLIPNGKALSICTIWHIVPHVYFLWFLFCNWLGWISFFVFLLCVFIVEMFCGGKEVWPWIFPPLMNSDQQLEPKTTSPRLTMFKGADWSDPSMVLPLSEKRKVQPLSLTFSSFSWEELKSLLGWWKVTLERIYPCPSSNYTSVLPLPHVIPLPSVLILRTLLSQLSRVLTIEFSLITWASLPLEYPSMIIGDFLLRHPHLGDRPRADILHCPPGHAPDSSDLSVLLFIGLYFIYWNVKSLRVEITFLFACTFLSPAFSQVWGT